MEIERAIEKERERNKINAGERYRGREEEEETTLEKNRRRGSKRRGRERD